MSHQRRCPARDVSSKTQRQPSFAQIRKRAISPAEIASTSGVGRARQRLARRVVRAVTMGDFDAGERRPELQPGATVEDRVERPQGPGVRRPALDLRVPELAEGGPGHADPLEPGIALTACLRAEVLLVGEAVSDKEVDRGPDRREVVVGLSVGQLERVDQVQGRARDPCRARGG